MKKTSSGQKPSSSKSSQNKSPRRKPRRDPRRQKPPVEEPTYKLKPGIMHREIEGQILILTPREEFLYTVNDSGRLLWQRLVRGTTEQKLAAALVKQYGLSDRDARRDVKTFLQSLRAQGILTRA